jgi:membrane-bound inhibitor of C-type lysozyme
LHASRRALAVACLAASACSRPIPATTFACEGGDSLVVGFAPRFAELHLPPNRIVRLYPERAASGARYGDGRYALHTKDGEALLERAGKLLLRGCRTPSALAAPDSAPISAQAFAAADSIDSLLAGVKPAERTLPAAERGQRARELALWADSGRALRLRVSDPDEPATPDAHTDYYFADGRLLVVRGPVSQYVFRDTTLILWTTDSLQHAADIPLRDMQARQNFILGEVRQYLAMFGLEQ